MINFIDVNESLYKIKDFSSDSLTFLDKGSTGDIYSVSEDKVLKLFNKNFDKKFILSEFYLSTMAYNHGVKCPYPYDIVKVNNAYGIIYEWFHGVTLCSYINNNPKNFNIAIQQYFNLIKNTNNIECLDCTIPSAKQNILSKLKDISNIIGKDKYKQIKDLIDRIPESNHLLHGDPNVKNCIFVGDDLFFIDMGTIVKGSYIFDLASMLATYKFFNLITVDNDKNFYNWDTATSLKLVDCLLKLYNLDDNILKIANIIALINIMHLCNFYFSVIIYAKFDSKEECLKILVDKISSYLN